MTFQVLIWLVILQMTILIAAVGFFFFKAKIDKMFGDYTAQVSEQLSKWNIRIQAVEKTTNQLNETASELFKSIQDGDGRE